MTVTINASTSSGLITTADTSGVLALQTAGTTALTIDASQNVGIGNSLPKVRFQVTPATNASEPSLGTANSGSVFTSANANYGLNLGVAATGYTWMQAMRFDGTATAYDLALQTAGGNVGIGTAGPLGKFHVKGTTAADMTCRIEPYTNAYASKLLISSTSSGDGGIQYGAGGGNNLDIFAYDTMKFLNGSIGFAVKL